MSKLIGVQVNIYSISFVDWTMDELRGERDINILSVNRQDIFMVLFPTKGEIITLGVSEPNQFWNPIGRSGKRQIFLNSRIPQPKWHPWVVSTAFLCKSPLSST